MNKISLPVMVLLGITTLSAGVAVWYFFFRVKGGIILGPAPAKAALLEGKGEFVSDTPTTTTPTPTTPPTPTEPTVPTIPTDNGGITPPPTPVDAQLQSFADTQYAYNGSINQAASTQLHPDQLRVEVIGFENGRAIIHDAANAGGDAPHYLINSGYWLDSIDHLALNPEMPWTIQLFRSNSGNPYDWQSAGAYRGYSNIYFTAFAS